MRKTLLVLVLIMLTFACQQEAKVPELNPLATPLLQNPEQWAVVTGAYVPLRSDNRLESSTVRVLRKADVLHIKGISAELYVIEDNADYWYNIQIEGDSGWVHGSYLHFYATRAQAMNAAERL